MDNTVYGFLDIFADSDMQKVALYDLKTDKVVFEGTRDEMPGEYHDLEIQTIDCIEKNSDVLTINVEV